MSPCVTFCHITYVFFSDLSSLSSSSDDLSTSLSSDEDENNPPSTESFSSPDAEEEDMTENLSTIDETETEVIYSDPLDALEKATDTRIYNCPEFDENEEVIYEEAGQKIDITTKSSPKQSPKSPKRRKRATMSTATGM